MIHIFSFWNYYCYLANKTTANLQDDKQLGKNSIKKISIFENSN